MDLAPLEVRERRLGEARRRTVEQPALQVFLGGERDGVQGPSIAKCVEAAGGKVVYAVTECFV